MLLYGEIFLDTKIVYSNDVIAAKVNRNERKLPVHWSSRFQNGIKGALSLVI